MKLIDLTGQKFGALARKFAEHGYRIQHIINNGISIVYATMTSEESYEKAERNLMNGGRMSD